MVEYIEMNVTYNTTPSFLVNETSFQQAPNPTPLQTLLIAVSFIICVTGFIGNALIARIILSFKAMRTPTNWFLLNLAICNLAIVIIVIPYQQIHQFVSWSFGEIGCKYLIMPVMEHFAGVCVLTYTAISFARYVIIRKPGASFVNKSKPIVIITIIVIWVISFLVLSTMLMGVLGKFILETKNGGDRSNCELRWLSYEKRKIYRVFVFVLTYAIPMVTTGFSYWKIQYIIAKNTKKVTGHIAEDVLLIRHRKNRQMNTALMKMYVMFAVFTLPLQLFLVLFDFKRLDTNHGPMIFDILTMLFYAQILSSPFSLLYMSNEYREKIRCTKYCCLVVVPKMRTFSSEMRSSFLRRSKRISQPDVL